MPGRLVALFLGPVLAAALAGCSLAPKYVRPEAPVANDWPVAGAEGGRAAGELGRAEVFGDARLRALVTAALENNRDLRRSVLAIERARAQYRIVRADRLPALGLDAGAVIGGDFEGAVGTTYEVGLSVTAFELDLFGRVKSLSDAALAEFAATKEAADAARIALVSEVATAYFAEQAYAEQLALAERSLAAREQSFGLDQQRFDAGIASEIDLRQSESLVESARVEVAVLARGRAQAENALALLVGAPAEGLPAPVPLADQGIPADLAAGVPSEVLLDRPDVRAAEERLRAANADIGAARAAFFPRISLTATAGTASAELLGLFAAGSGVWSFIPALTQPIFAFGKNRANLDVAKVDRDLAVAAYERAIQVAFREVADALVARGPLDTQVAAQERLRDAEARRLALAQERYGAGLTSHLELLDAERSLFRVEQALVQARQLRLTNAIDLYAALGGGLGEAADAPAQP